MLAASCAAAALFLSGPCFATTIFVSNEKDNTVTVVDADTLKVIDTIKVSRRPRGVMLSPDFKELFVQGMKLFQKESFSEARGKLSLAAEKLVQENNLEYAAVAKSMIAMCFDREQKYVEALGSFQEAHKAWIRLHGGKPHARIAMSLSNVASCLRDLGRHEEALVKFRKAMEMRRELDDQAGIAGSIHNIADTLLALGRIRTTVNCA